MTKIIKNGAIVESDFTVIKDDEVDISQQNQVLPLSVFLANKDALAGRTDFGIWLDSHEEVETISQDINCPVIALNFPAFTDGRAYSSANILRSQYGYIGEIRAIGDVRRDQLEQMLRCGFDAFELAEGQDFEDAICSLKGFSQNYQTTADRPEPLFRRR